MHKQGGGRASTSRGFCDVLMRQDEFLPSCLHGDMHIDILTYRETAHFALTLGLATSILALVRDEAEGLIHRRGRGRGQKTSLSSAKILDEGTRVRRGNEGPGEGNEAPARE